ncbi:transporter substrate-binding domain-containing protein [Pseudoalteromonas sp. MMG005]|uniref:substrate-binding periplasmic protein n=1 Tax=Pseudoalteromonas sp. MMG005 TaxID=2822682 RepID=UPI0032B4582B
MGVGTSWPPYVMYDDVRYTGLDVEITEQVFLRAGFCVEFVKLPSSARGIVELQKGEIDVLPSASYNKSRAKIAHFSKGYRRERMRLFTRHINQPINSLTELFSAEYTFTANPGAYYGEELAQILTIKWYKQRLFEVASVTQRMELVKRGRVDFLIEDEISGLYFKRLLGYKDIQLHSYVVNDNAIHFMLNRKNFDNEKVKKVNNAISELKVSLKAIEDKYTKWIKSP